MDLRLEQQCPVLDLCGYSFDELSRTIALATKKVEEFRGKRIKELQAELRLAANSRRRGSRLTGKSLYARSSSGRSAQKRAPAVERKIAAQFRGPSGEEYSGRGAIPRWAKNPGISER